MKKIIQVSIIQDVFYEMKKLNKKNEKLYMILTRIVKEWVIKSKETK